MPLRPTVLLLVLALCRCLPAWAANPLPANAWSEVTGPSAGPPRSIGGFADGCIAGAVELPVDGTGYEAIRLSRRRNYGQTDTIDFIQSLGRQANAANLPLFYIGDIGQPRGGPLPYGHASHQTGLDVDIWFTLDGTRRLAPNAREDVPLPSMLGAGGTVDPDHFDRRQVTLLRLAATEPRVERIFVSPAIKLALCHGYAGSADGGTAWLHRLSPWWGHDDHFHVRIRCPASSPDCRPQPPVPPGDGCDAGLEHWAHHLTPPSVATSAAPRKPPAACLDLLKAD